MWTIARIFFIAALVTLVLPPLSIASVGPADLSFSWSQVLVLASLGAAWGDMRAQLKGHDERIKRLEKD